MHVLCLRPVSGGHLFLQSYWIEEENSYGSQEAKCIWKEKKTFFFSNLYNNGIIYTIITSSYVYDKKRSKSCLYSYVQGDLMLEEERYIHTSSCKFAI